MEFAREWRDRLASPGMIRWIVALWALLAAVSAIFAALPADTEAQCLLSVIALGGVIVLAQKSSEDPNDWRRALVLLAGIFLSFRYMVWRTLYTMQLSDLVSTLAAWLLYSAELYAFVIFVLGLFVNFYPLRSSSSI